MANNRYYIQCPVCKDQHYFGKSLGSGIYNMRAYQGKLYGPGEPFAPHRDINEADAEVLHEAYDFMWQHLINCLEDELASGTLFTIESEYPKIDEENPKHPEGDTN